MLRKVQQVAGVVSGAAGSTTKFLKAGIFGGILLEKLPEFLYTPSLGGVVSPLGTTAGLAAVAGLVTAKDKKDLAIKMVGTISAGALNAAVYLLEGQYAIYCFTGALGGRMFTAVLDAANKKGGLSHLEVADLVTSVGEAVLIIPSLYIGGTGNILEAAKAGTATVVQQYFAGGAALCSLFGGTFSAIKTINPESCRPHATPEAAVHRVATAAAGNRPDAGDYKALAGDGKQFEPVPEHRIAMGNH